MTEAVNEFELCCGWCRELLSSTELEVLVVVVVVIVTTGAGDGNGVGDQVEWCKKKDGSVEVYQLSACEIQERKKIRKSGSLVS